MKKLISHDLSDGVASLDTSSSNKNPVCCRLATLDRLKLCSSETFRPIKTYNIHTTYRMIKNINSFTLTLHFNIVIYLCILRTGSTGSASFMRSELQFANRKWVIMHYAVSCCSWHSDVVLKFKIFFGEMGT